MSATKSLLHPDEKIKANKIGSRLVQVGGAAGVILLVLGIILGGNVDQGFKWQRFFYAYLTAWMFVTSIALGALFFVLIHHLARARWGIVLRRMAEYIADALPVLFVLGLGFIIPVVAGYKHLYFWSDTSLHDPSHELYKDLHNRFGWFDTWFFAGRYVFYFVVYIGISRWFISRSKASDELSEADAAEVAERMRVWSGIATVVVSLTTFFFAWDLMMSLSPQWYSTIYPVNFFAGCMLSIHCVLALFGRSIQRSGRLGHSITTEHYHDIGKYMFGWTFFWVYTAFSQFMLQWYGNIPEETVFYNYRMFSQWQWVSWAVLLGQWAIPYLALVTRWTKRVLPLLMLLAAWQLVFHFVDLYWNIMPNQQWLVEGAVKSGIPQVLGPLQGDPALHKVHFHAVDVVMLLSMISLFLAAVGRSMKGNLLPVKDPKLAASLAFENY